MALLSGCAPGRVGTVEGAYLALSPLADDLERALLDHLDETPAAVIISAERLTAGVAALAL